MAKSVIREKSFAFALETIRLYRGLVEEREFVLSKQLLRSGTSIGANVEEAGAAQSRRDFLARMATASKEARETRYWLNLLKESGFTRTDVSTALTHIDEINRILTSIVKTTGETRDRE